MLLSIAALATPLGTQVQPTSVPIAPGVDMPLVNLGGVHSHPSNYSAWLKLGGTGLDTALMYGDDVQLDMGNAMAAVPRETLFVTSKVPCCPASGVSQWCSWYASEYPTPVDAFKRAEIDARLIGVAQVDLMLLHWPCDTMEETIAHYRRLEDFQLAGKARAIGISNFNASAIDALYKAGLRVPPSVNQCGFSIGNHNASSLGRDLATLAKCRERKITYSAYSPLGGLSHIDVLHNPTVKAIADAHNKSTAQVALRWVVQQGIVAVTASTEASHLASDLQIFDFALSQAEMAELLEVGART